MGGMNGKGRPYRVSVGGYKFTLEVWNRDGRYAGQATDEYGSIVCEWQGDTLATVNDTIVRNLRTHVRRMRRAD